MIALEAVGFIILGTLAVASALVVVFHRNPIISALALASNLVSIAGFYLLLNAQFLALLQVIVYAGAIMVLILFVIMMLNLSQDTAGLHRSGLIQRVLAPALTLACAGLLAWAVSRDAETARFAVSSSEFGTVRQIGRGLFTTFFYAFEAISLLLVVAMIGAVLLAKRRL